MLAHDHRDRKDTLWSSWNESTSLVICFHGLHLRNQTTATMNEWTNEPDEYEPVSSKAQHQIRSMLDKHCFQ